MFAEFLTKNEFFTQYIQLFATRFTIGNLEMEDSNTEMTNPSRAIEIYTNMKAFLSLIEKNPDKISPYDLIDVANIINNGIYTKGFRKTQVNVKIAKSFFPIPAKDVQGAIYSLFDSYYNIWNNLDIYEREARFHIELVRIQPFEDGNKRTARILTCFNLCKNNKAPIVICGEQTDEYFRCIDEYDVDSLSEMFKKNSKDELNVMMNLYENICDNYIIEDEKLDKDEDIRISSLLEKVKSENELSIETKIDDVYKLKI